MPIYPHSYIDSWTDSNGETGYYKCIDWDHCFIPGAVPDTKKTEQPEILELYLDKRMLKTVGSRTAKRKVKQVQAALQTFHQQHAVIYSASRMRGT